MLGFIVVAVLAVLIFMGFKNQKKIAAEQQKAVEKKKIAEQRAAEEKKIAEQKAADEEKEFLATFNAAGEIDAILSVLEKSHATADNFEKGVAHAFDKNEIKIPKEKFLLIMKNELFTRAFTNNDSVTAKAVAIDYFKESVIDSTTGLLDKYMRFKVSRDQGYGLADFEHPFIKSLYGIVGRATNYKAHGLTSGDYQLVSPEYYIDVIEGSDVLKSYTDKDPFTVDEVRKTWSNDLYNAPIELVTANGLSSAFNDEKQIDEAFYIVYLGICQELGVDSNEVSIGDAYFDYLKKIYK